MRAALAIAISAAAFGLYTRVQAHWMPLGWIGLVPLLCVLEATTSLAGAVAAGWIFSMAFVVAVFGWFAPAISSYTGSSLPVSLLILVLVAPVLQPQFLTWTAARHWMRSRSRAHGEGGPSDWTATVMTAVAAACAYVGTEFLWPKLFGDTIGYGFYPSASLRQTADIAGAAGLTFVVLILNELALVALHPQRWRSHRRAALAALVAAAGVLLSMSAYGRFRLQQIEAESAGRAPVTAALVQASIGSYERLRADVGAFQALRMILKDHFELSHQALKSAPIDVVVWPETAYPTTFGSPKSEAGAEFDEEMRLFASYMGKAFVFGTYDFDGQDEFNSAVFLDAPRKGSTSAVRSYRKANLFPLTERVPEWLESEQLRKRLPWLGTWKAGAGAEIVKLTLANGREVRIAPLICLDAVEPEMAAEGARRGAELLLTLSNDGWFAGGNGARLHLIVSIFRSIETHLPQLRATNTGVSAAISAGGDLVALAGVDERSALIATVTPVAAMRTLAVQWGQWFGPFSLAAAALLAVAAQLRRAR